MKLWCHWLAALQLLLIAAGVACARPQEGGTASAAEERLAEKLEIQIHELESADNYPEAIKKAGDRLDLLSRIRGKEHHQTVDARWELERLKKVGALSVEDRAAWRRTVEEVLDAAPRLEARGRLEEALALRRKLLELRQRTLGEEHPLVSTSLNGMALNLTDQRRFAEAETLHRQSLALSEKTQGPNHPDTATSCNNLAANLNAQGKFAQAEPYYRRALEVREKVLGPDHPETLASLGHVGTNLDSQGKHAEAEALLRRAFSGRKRGLGNADLDTAIACNNLASNLNRQGRPREAEPLLLEALTICKAAVGNDHPTTAIFCNNLAVNLMSQGNFVAAEPYYRQALAIRLKTSGDDALDTALSCANLAANLHSQGKWSEAEALARKALAIRSKALGENHPSTAVARRHVANILSSQERLEEAEKLCRQALEVLEKSQGDKHPDTAECQRLLATILKRQGRFAEAEELARSALRKHESLLGPRHPQTASSCRTLALNLEAQGRFAEAEPLWRKSLDITRERYGDLHPAAADRLCCLAMNLNLQARHAEAEPTARAAVAALEASRLRVAATGLERSAATEIAPRVTWAASLIHLGRLPEAAQVLEGHFARGLLDEFSQQQGSRLSPEEQKQLDTINAELLQLDRKLAAVVRTPSEDAAGQERFAALVRERIGWEARLAELAAQLQQREIYDLKRIQAALPRDTALIAWLDTRRPLSSAHWVLLLKSSGEPLILQAAGRGPNGSWNSADDALAQEVRGAILSGKRAPGSAAPASSSSTTDLRRRIAELAQQRLGPVAPHLDGISHLAVLPSPALAQIPVELLTDKQTVSYAPSGTVLARLLERAEVAPEGKIERSARPQAILAVGDPVFMAPGQPPQDLLAANSRGPLLQPLPGSRLEVEAIAALFPRSEKLLGSAAARPRLAELEPRLHEFGVIHFATHGLVNSEMALQSALALSQSPAEDGLLTAQEMKDRWRLNADLIVLSACDSGLGRKAVGEGYLGFSQALFLAGGRSVIVSQWPVSDAATVLLMRRFYQNWLGRRPDLTEPMPKAAALREAKQWLRGLHRTEVDRSFAELPQAARGLKLEPQAVDAAEDKPFAHPRYWAAFVLVGDPR
jgi:CHAT domain-containing protein/tetratricopeptide (TPR) repeat protein